MQRKRTTTDPPTKHFLNQYYIIPHGICTLIYWIPSFCFLSFFIISISFWLKKQKDQLQLAFYLLLSFSFHVLQYIYIHTHTLSSSLREGIFKNKRAFVFESFVRAHFNSSFFASFIDSSHFCNG